MYCGNCDKTDGNCYTSFPPKVKCTVTGNFHFYDDECDAGRELVKDENKYEWKSEKEEGDLKYFI